MRITASDTAHWANGALTGPECPEPAEGISFDTRTLAAGQAFIAVRGQRDGHGYLDDAVSRGARFLVVERGRSIEGATCVEVDDTVGALAAVARGARDVLAARNRTAVVGVTGSAGKTSTKNMVRAVLGSGFRAAHGAVGSYNNDLGLPSTIINAPDACDAMVLELAMRGFGEIARLCRVCRPNVSVLTVIGDAHSDRVGGIEGVARAKGEILEGMDPAGTAVVNLDDPWTPSLLTRLPAGAAVVTYGRGGDADVRWEITARADDGRATATFAHGGASAACEVPMPGDHMVGNAAAAIAAGIALGLDLRACVASLPSAVGEPGRMQWVTGRAGLRILDDSYNANSSSMLAALEVVAGVPAEERIAVLGVIAEVAEPSVAHRAVASRAAELGIEVLPLETDLYGAPGMSLEAVIAAVGDRGAGTVLLAKGSKVAGTGRVVRALSSD